MYIKMNDDKSLIITVKTTLYRGESNADMITFLIPKNYNDINIADCSVLMRYVEPDGNGKSEALRLVPEMYKNYYQFSTVVDTGITKEVGDIPVWLTVIDGADCVVLKTGETVIEIEPSRNISECMCTEELDQLDQLAIKVAKLEQTKADNIIFNEEDSTIQLLANGGAIGDRIAISSSAAGVYVSSVELNDNNELVIKMSDGTEEIIGTITCDGHVVYVPHIDERKVLTFTIESTAGEIPDPVDLNPHDEWSDVDETEVVSDYIWEEM